MINKNAKLEYFTEGNKIIISYKVMDDYYNYSDFSLILADDIVINAYCDDDFKTELIFDISEDNPLYNPLSSLLKDDNSIKIASDYRREEYDDSCYIEILRQDKNIRIKFINDIKDYNYIDKFNYIIINISYDLRSKLDQRNTDYKKRLVKLFEDSILSIKKTNDQKVKKLIR